MRFEYFASVYTCVAALLVAAPAAAQPARDWARCANDTNAYSSEKAIKGCTAIIKAGRGERRELAIAFYNRANAFYGAGDFDRAIDDYGAAIRLDPTYASAFSNRGNAYSLKGDPDKAIADYDAAIRFNPNYTIALSNRADIYRTKGDFDRAIADYSAAIQASPKRARLFLDRGSAYRGKGDIKNAVADFDQAIKLDPKYADAHLSRGLAHYDANDYDRAMADLNQAINLNHRQPKALYSRGLVYTARHDYDRAIADYSEAITLNPKYAVAYNNRGIAYKALGRTQDAIADARMAQLTNQANQTSDAQLALSLPGTLQAITGADTEAVNAAMNRLSINLPMSVAGIDPVKRSLDGLSREPCDRQAIVNLALALEKLGRKREAANAQVSFSGACGGHVPSLKGAASILLDLSDYAGAATAASELIKLEPFDDSGYHLRAVAYDRSGSAKKAIDDYLTGLELLGNKVNLSSDIYLAVAHNYEKLGQFCDAALSVETWVALNPARNDSSRMQTIIADYTAKGRCESPGSRAEEVFRFPPQKNVVRVPVTVNGVRGTFILDTGATFVSLKEAFAQKAKVQIDPDSKVRMHTANGIADARRGRATTVQLRSLQAKDVAVIVHDNVPGSFGDGVDGLLGMSFLSRFKVSIDAHAVKIANRNGK